MKKADILATALIIMSLWAFSLSVENSKLQEKNDSLAHINNSLSILVSKDWDINLNVPVGFRCTRATFDSSEKDGVDVFYDTSRCDESNPLEKEEILYYKALFGKESGQNMLTK